MLGTSFQRSYYVFGLQVAFSLYTATAQTRLEDNFRDHLVQPLPKAGSARTGCPRPHPAEF